MSNVWLTSDLHLAHANILKYCNRNQFLSKRDQEELKRRNGDWNSVIKPGVYDRYKIDNESVNNMNEALINNTNKYVKENDILYHLGDFVFGSRDKYYNNAKEFRSQIRCKTVYNIWGNHDDGCISDLFTGTFDQVLIEHNRQRFFLNHYAMAIWPKQNKGAIHCFGHSHSNAEKMLDQIMPNRRSMDVGVDNAFKLLGEYRPFHMNEIIKFVGSRPITLLDHHS